MRPSSVLRYALALTLASTLASTLGVPGTGRAAATSDTKVVVEYYTYLPGDVNRPTLDLTIRQGSSVTLVNIDPVGGEHSITSDDVDINLVPIFDSGLIDEPASRTVTGVGALPPGDYAFHCSVHWYVPMRGILHVTP